MPELGFNPRLRLSPDLCTARYTKLRKLLATHAFREHSAHLLCQAWLCVGYGNRSHRSLALEVLAV